MASRERLRPIYRCREGGFAEDPAECRMGGELLMTGEQRLRLSKLMSALLRHLPHEAGLRLDEGGWVEVSELVKGIRERWRNREAYWWVTRDHVVAVALLDPKGRFQLSPDMRRIRASYGHSVRVELGYQPLQPRELPERLYHGTPRRNLASIMARGLLPMRRLMVHLSPDPRLAVEVGRRHGGDVVVLEVDPRCLAGRGVRVYRASRVVYLAERVPPECIRRILEPPR